MYCKSPNVKRNGRSKDNKQRYLCLSCGRTYYWKISKTKESRRYQWFVLWITEAYSIRELSKMKKVSNSTVRRVIAYWLKREPPEIDADYGNIKHVIFDGSFLNRPWGIYAVMDGETHKLIVAQSNVKETAEYLLKFYRQLGDKGLEIQSATVDGNIQQIKALKQIWPNVILQRCIVHVQRQGLSWCRRNPKRTDAKYLRELFLKLIKVKTKEDARRFTKTVYAWGKGFGIDIESSPNRGKVFSDIIRARSMLIKSLPDLFHYIDAPSIACSTNALEGYFSRLKEHITAYIAV